MLGVLILIRFRLFGISIKVVCYLLGCDCESSNKKFLPFLKKYLECVKNNPQTTETFNKAKNFCQIHYC